MSELVKRNPDFDPEAIKKSKLLPEHLQNDRASLEFMAIIADGLGIKPGTAIQHIYVFKPKNGNRLQAGMSAHLYGALAIAAGHDLHVSGNAIEAKGVLIRKADNEKIQRYRILAEDERRNRQQAIETAHGLYRHEREFLRDQIEDLERLALIAAEKPDSPEAKGVQAEIAKIQKQLQGLQKQYGFDTLRQSLTQGSPFDLEKILRHEVVWTMAMAQQAGFTSNPKYGTQPREMLEARAQVSVVRRGAIDVILGVRSFFADLGVEYDGDPNKDLAIDGLLLDEDEMHLIQGSDGEPIMDAELVDVTSPKVSPRQAQLLDLAAEGVSKRDADGVARWAQSILANEKRSARQRETQLMAIQSVLLEDPKGDTLLENGNTLRDEIRTLTDSLTAK